jgi:hypothetical protein
MTRAGRLVRRAPSPAYAPAHELAPPLEARGLERTFLCWELGP